VFVTWEGGERSLKPEVKMSVKVGEEKNQLGEGKKSIWAKEKSVQKCARKATGEPQQLRGWRGRASHWDYKSRCSPEDRKEREGTTTKANQTEAPLVWLGSMILKLEGDVFQIQS